MCTHADDDGNHHGVLCKFALFFVVVFARAVGIVFVAMGTLVDESGNAKADGNRRHAQDPRIFEAMWNDVE